MSETSSAQLLSKIQTQLLPPFTSSGSTVTAGAAGAAGAAGTAVTPPLNTPVRGMSLSNSLVMHLSVFGNQRKVNCCTHSTFLDHIVKYVSEIGGKVGYKINISFQGIKAEWLWTKYFS